MRHVSIIISTALLLSGCGLHPGLPYAGRFGQAAAVPDGKTGVVMLQVTDSGLATSDAPSFNLRLVQIEPNEAANGGRAIDVQSLTIYKSSPPGFATVRLTQGDYYIRAFDVPYRGYCLGAQTVAFHVAAGTFTVLGTLDGRAYLGRLLQDASADAAGPRRSTTKAADGHDMFAVAAPLDQSAQGLSPAGDSVLQAARAYLDTRLQPSVDVTPAVFRPISRGQESNTGVDACGAVPKIVARANLEVQSVTPGALLVPGMFPAAQVDPNRSPATFLPGLAFTAQGGSPPAYRLDLTDDLVYLDPQCNLTTRAAMVAQAGSGTGLYAELVTYTSQDGSRAYPPHVRLFKRFSGDAQSCLSAVTR